MALTGAGTQSNPYLIYTADDLVDTYSYNGVGIHFKLMNDISLPYRDSRFPISSFVGIFDGNGKKLTNLNIFLTNNNYVGLFGYVYEATFKNLRIEGFNIVGKSVVGCIAGESYDNVVFENVSVGYYSFATTYSQYSSTYHTAGGYIGYAYNPVTFRNCHNNGIIVKAYSNVGGFIGNGASGSIYEQCYSNPLSGNSYATSGGVGAWGNPNMQGNASTSYYEIGQDLIDWYNGATPLTNAQLKEQSAMPKFDWSNRWGFNANFNEGYPIQKVFLPQEMPAVIEQRTVFFDLDALSITAVIRMITPFVKSLNVEFGIQPIDTNVEALAKLYTPFVKKIEVTHSINLFSMSAYAQLIRIIRKQIEVIHSMNPMDFESKRLQLKKSISEIIHYVNEISVGAVMLAKLQPIQLNNLVRLLESGNDIALIQYLINDVYINESRHSTHNLQSQSEVTALAYTGDTVTLKVAFKTYNDVAIEPTDVKVKIYKQTSTSNELISTISLSEADRQGIGQYEYLYTIPSITDSKYLVYEFSGMYNGQITLARGKFNVRFV